MRDGRRGRVEEGRLVVFCEGNAAQGQLSRRSIYLAKCAIPLVWVDAAWRSEVS